MPSALPVIRQDTNSRRNKNKKHEKDNCVIIVIELAAGLDGLWQQRSSDAASIRIWRLYGALVLAPHSYGHGGS